MNTDGEPNDESRQVMTQGRPRSVALQRQARAAVLWAIGVLVLGQAFLRYGIDHLWPELRDPAFEIKARRLTQVIAQSPRPPVTVLMFGSSVARNIFRAEYLEEQLSRELNRPAAVMNMSCVGAGPLTELVWTRRLLDRGVRPDFVCVEVTPFLYNTPGPPFDAPRFPEHLLTEADLEIVERYSGDAELRHKWSQFRWFPAYEHRLTIVNCLSESLVPIQDRVPTWRDSKDRRFWAALPSPSAEQLQATLVNVKGMFESQLRYFAPGEPSIHALEELLALLHREGIPTAVILAPVGPTVRKLYPKEPLDRFVQQVIQLSDRYSCRYLDAFDWLGEDMFGDSIHATAEGADVFSNRLAREVLLPALAAPQ